MFKLTRKAKKVQSLMGAVTVQNAGPIVLQSIKNPKMIPAVITMDQYGIRLDHTYINFLNV